MSEEKGEVVSLWATHTNAARMKWAKKLGINVSAIANRLFDKHLARELEKAVADKQKELREALNAPMP